MKNVIIVTSNICTLESRHNNMNILAFIYMLTVPLFEWQNVIQI